MRCHRNSAELSPVLVSSPPRWYHHNAMLQVAVDSGVTVVLDCGGADGPISAELLNLVAYLSPNETELARLTGAHPRVLPVQVPDTVPEQRSMGNITLRR